MTRLQLLEKVTCALLSRHHGAGTVRCRVVRDLSPRLSPATTLRLEIDPAWGWGRTVIAKIMTATHHDNDFRGYQTQTWREVEVYRHGVVAEITGEVVTPKLFALDEEPEGTWLWLEDVEDRLRGDWNLAAAQRAVVAMASLHLGGSGNPSLPGGAAYDWRLAEYDAFTHHVGKARASLQAQLDPATDEPTLLPHRMARLGSRLLDNAPLYSRELAAAPHCFNHGDFHVDNAGWSPEGKLLLLDWAQAGVGPVGGDVAVFLSNFRSRGGDAGVLTRARFDEVVVAQYCRELESLGADDALLGAVRRVVDLWSVSWAVQVRLGPGLSYARRQSDPSVRDRVMADIREGLERAEEAAERLRSPEPL